VNKEDRCYEVRIGWILGNVRITIYRGVRDGLMNILVSENGKIYKGMIEMLCEEEYDTFGI